VSCGRTADLIEQHCFHHGSNSRWVTNRNIRGISGFCLKREIPMANPQKTRTRGTPPNFETQGLGHERRVDDGDQANNPPQVPVIEMEQPVTLTRPRRADEDSNDMSRAEERSGTRQIWMWGIALITAIFLALLVASYLATT
jgi:hypothetical protein